MIDDKIILQTLSMKFDTRKAIDIYQEFTKNYYNKHLHEVYNQNNRLLSTTQWYENRAKIMYRYMNIYYFRNYIGAE